MQNKSKRLMVSEKKLHRNFELPKIFSNRPIKIRSQSKEGKRRIQSDSKPLNTLSIERSSRKLKPSNEKLSKSTKSKFNNLEISQNLDQPKLQDQRKMKKSFVDFKKMMKFHDSNTLKALNTDLKIKRTDGEKRKVLLLERKPKKHKNSVEEEYWRHVNESMIIATPRQEEASKDLRELMETFVTQ